MQEYPYVAVIDPRTGECMRSWNNLNLPATIELLKSFMKEHNLPLDGSPNKDNTHVSAAQSSKLHLQSKQVQECA